MIAKTKPRPTRQIRLRVIEQFRPSIESWERQWQEAGRDGDAELAAACAVDVADLRAILQLLETGAFDEAAETIDCLDTLVRDQLPRYLSEKVVEGN